MKTYLANVGLSYDGERDELLIQIGRPNLKPLLRVQMRVLFDLDTRQRLVRVVLNDGKMLHLALALAHLPGVSTPELWVRGHVAYDEAARVALLYCGPLPQDALSEQVSRRGIVELDKDGRLLAIRASCRGGRGGDALRNASAQG